MGGVLDIRAPSPLAGIRKPSFLSTRVFGSSDNLGAKPIAGQRSVCSECLQYLLEIRSESDQIGMFSTHESCTEHLVGHDLDRFEESIYVEERARFRVDTQPCPTPLFKDFFQGTDASRQSDKAICKLSHSRLSFVHGINDKQLRKSGVRDFLIHQRARNYSGHFAASGEGRVGNNSHESRSPSAVNNLTPLLHEPSTSSLRGVRIRRVVPGTGSAENAYTHAGMFSHATESVEQPSEFNGAVRSPRPTG
jgi:hypothetical protein